MPRIDAPRGTRDFAPGEAELRRWALDRLLETARRRGFREVQTPIFEHLELFTLKSGEGIVDQLYDFEDKSGRELALRPELTAPVMRFYVDELRSHPKPLKVFYHGPCFRYERPQAGRYREFYQFGTELIGPDTPEADAESIAAAVACVEALGLETFDLKVGHIGFLTNVLDGLGVEADLRSKLFPLIDKQDEQALDLLEKAGHDPDPVERYAFGAPRDPAALDALADDVEDETARTALERLGEVAGSLDALGAADVGIDLGVVRGLDYYTGVVFEIEAPKLGAEKQICGGGAYTLSELFGGEPVGSTGFALGFDRVLLALEEEGSLPELDAGVTVHVVPIGDDQRAAGLELACRLREAGIACEVDLSRRGPSKNLDHADRIGARAALLLGSDEADRGVVAVKDLGSGDQEDVPVDDVVDHVRDLV